MRLLLQSIREYAFLGGMVTDFIQRVRSALEQKGVTHAGLARKAGLHRNTLYGVEKDDWNPSANVLKALEPHIKAIEAGSWHADDPAPEAQAA